MDDLQTLFGVDDILIVASAIFVTSTLASTMYPSIPGGDAGELTAAACNWSVAHPPGYPTFTILGGIFIQLIPWVSPASAVSFSSLFLSHLAFLLQAFAVKRLSRMLLGTRRGTLKVWKMNILYLHPGAVLAPTTFFLSRTVWLYSYQPEVFAMNNFFMSLLLWATVYYYESPSVGRGMLGVFVSAFSCSNQHSSVFFIFPTALMVAPSLTFTICKLRILFQMRIWLLLVIVGLLGFSPYLYIVLSSRQKNPFSWGDESTLEGFMHHFLRKEYGTFRLFAEKLDNDPGTWYRASVYLNDVLEEFPQILIPMAAIGACSCLLLSSSTGCKTSTVSSRPAMCMFTLLFSYCVYVTVFCHLSNLDLSNPLFLGVQRRFWMQPNVYLCFFFGIGIEMMIGSRCLFSWSLARVCAIISAGFCLVVVFDQQFIIYRGNRHLNDFSETIVYREYAKSLLETVPKNSILLVNGDLINNLAAYYNGCEGMGKDRNVDVVGLQQMTYSWFVPIQRHHYPDIVFPGPKYHPFDGGFSIAEFISANRNERPIILCGGWKEGDSSWKRKYNSYSWGLCNRIVKKVKKPKEEKLWMQLGMKRISSVPDISKIGKFVPDRYDETSWERVAYSDIWGAHMLLCNSLMMSAVNSSKLLEMASKYSWKLFINNLEEFLKYSQWAITNLDTFNYLKNAGVIFGQFADRVSKTEGASKKGLEWDSNMLKVWNTALKLNTTGVNEADILSLRHSTETRVNPWSQFYIPTKQEYIRWKSRDRSPDGRRPKRPRTTGLLNYLTSQTHSSARLHEKAHPWVSEASTHESTTLSIEKKKKPFQRTTASKVKKKKKKKKKREKKEKRKTKTKKTNKKVRKTEN